MQDLERGQRIKDARLAKRLTQPAVVQLLRERAGAEVVTLRGYQSWEGGGGIRWENAKVLADVLDLDAERIMSGEPEPTPDPFAEAAADPAKVAELLESVHTLLQKQNELLGRQSKILERIEKAISVEDEAAKRLAVDGDAWADAVIARIEARAPASPTLVPKRKAHAK